MGPKGISEGQRLLNDELIGGERIQNPTPIQEEENTDDEEE